MTMAFRVNRGDLDFLQSRSDYAEGEEWLADLDRDEDAQTTAVRVWISPDTANRVALIAKAHDVPASVVLGTMIRNGVSSWPGMFEESPPWDPDSDHVDIEEIISRNDPKRT